MRDAFSQFPVVTRAFIPRYDRYDRSPQNKRTRVPAAVGVYSSRLLKKTHLLRCRSIASLQRTVSTPPLVDFRAPRIWIFLSSLQEAFFSTLLEVHLTADAVPLV